MALKIIKSHINTLSDDQSGREWLRWAIRIDGPLFFKVPTPYDCPSDRKDPRYVVSNSIARHWNSRLKLRARLNSTESAGPPDVEVHSSACHAIPSPQVGFRCKAKSSAGLVFTCDGGGMSLKFEYLMILSLKSTHDSSVLRSWNAPFVHVYNLIMSRISPMITGDQRSSAITLALPPSTTTGGKKSWMRVTTIP